MGAGKPGSGRVGTPHIYLYKTSSTWVGLSTLSGPDCALVRRPAHWVKQNQGRGMGGTPHLC